jgi:hypothetical protein
MATRNGNTDEAARTVRAVTDEVTNAGEQTARAGADIARRGAETARDSLQSGLDTTTETFQRINNQFTRALGLSGHDSEALTRQASENLGALAETSTVLARGMQEVSHEWLRLSQHGLQKNIEGLTQLARCRSMQDLVAVQSELMRDNWQYMIDVSRQIAERSIEIANEATQKIGSETQQTAERTRRAA